MKIKENIYIKNFAGISSIDLEIKPINLLIGSQGVGKSIIVKLLYFFKNIFDEVYSNYKFKDTIQDFVETKEKERFKTFFAESAWLENSNFEICYTDKQGHKYKIYGTSREHFTIQYPDELVEVLDYLTVLRGEVVNIDLELKNISTYISKHSEFTKLAERIISKDFGQQLPQVFIPSGRSFFSAVNENIYSILSASDKNASLDPFLLNFGSLYQRCKEYSTHLYSDTKNSLDTVIEEVLGGGFMIDENGKEFILHKDSRRVELKNTSSGQQEALPLLLILKAIISKQMHPQGCVLFIEEPEAHLFPTAQYSIVNLLAKLYNSNTDNIQIFITTHSPYILSSFNNLIYAGNLAKKDKAHELEILKLIEKDQLLNHTIVSANAITTDKNIYLIDDENQIISASLLDSISNNIAEEFDKLLDIEFS